MHESKINIFNNNIFSAQVEAASYLAENIIDAYFQGRPVDMRYDSVKMQSFQPLESLSNASSVSFNLPRFLGPSAYIPGNMLLKLAVKLETGASQVIPAGKRVSPINNIIHSCFRSLRVYVGDTLISKSSENYNFKSYMIDYLSYDGFAKYSWMVGNGWYQDSFGHTLAQQTDTNNSGFENRRKLFRNDEDDAYIKESVTFVARLHTDFNNTQSALLPGMGLKVDLGFATNEFLLQVPEADSANKYKLTITNATLMCPVAQLTPDLYRRLEHRLVKESAKIYFNRAEVTNKSISKTKLYEQQLFPGAPLPSRFILAFVPTSAYFGTITSNPYYFARTFSELTASQQQVAGGNASTSGTSGSGLFSSLRGQNDDFEVMQGDDHVFIENVTVRLNGESLDGFDDGNATRRHAMAHFLRMHYYQGFVTSRTGNNATYEEFLHGFYFLYYDLSTASQAGLEYVIPAVRQGNLHLQVIFSDTLPVEVTLLVYAEYPTLMTMDKNRQIALSY